MDRLYTKLIDHEDWSFGLFGSEKFKTQVFEFFDPLPLEKALDKKLFFVMACLDANDLYWSKEERFKHLEDGIWEIKYGSLRIACVWKDDKSKLVAIYAFDKKSDKWPKKHLENMRVEHMRLKGEWRK